MRRRGVQIPTSLARKLGLPARSRQNVDLTPAGKAARTYRGVLYASKAEAMYAAQLDLELKCKRIKAWERQVPIPLEVNGTLICTMRVDFKVTHLDGRDEYIETKGCSTREYRLTARLLRALYPEMNYRLVKL